MVKSKEDIVSENKKLIAINEELEDYFQNTIIPQLFVDANLILRKFTPSAMTQFNLSANDTGKHIEEVSHHIRFPTLVENIKEVIYSGQNLEKEIQTTDLRWYQMNILPYKMARKNMTNGVIITFVEISSRINYLNELEKLTADHETFIYAVSHDLSGPLANLEGLVDILKRTTNQSDDGKKIIDLIDTSLATCRKLLNELSDVTRTRHNLTRQAERINIENILEDVRLALKDRIISSDATITTAIKVSEIKFIRKNLRSIVYNLLSNAIKYQAPDRAPEIFIKTEALEGCVLLSISDNGSGIEENRLDTIFAEYSRIRKDVEGKGIGLFLVKKMVENGGGKIEVESTLGKGTTFRIYFKDEHNRFSAS